MFEAYVYGLRDRVRGILERHRKGERALNEFELRFIERILELSEEYLNSAFSQKSQQQENLDENRPT